MGIDRLCWLTIFDNKNEYWLDEIDKQTYIYRIQITTENILVDISSLTVILKYKMHQKNICCVSSSADMKKSNIHTYIRLTLYKKQDM